MSFWTDSGDVLAALAESDGDDDRDDGDEPASGGVWDGAVDRAGVERAGSPGALGSVGAAHAASAAAAAAAQQTRSRA